MKKYLYSKAVVLSLILLLGIGCKKNGTEPEPPDNNKSEVIAFCSENTGGGDIYVMEADGSNPRRVTTNDDVDHWPAWSPDGTRIAFASLRNGNVDIYVHYCPVKQENSSAYIL